MVDVALVPTTRARLRVRFANPSPTSVWLDAAAIPMFGSLPLPSAFITDPLFTPAYDSPVRVGPGLVCLAPFSQLLSDEVALAALFEIPPYASFSVRYQHAHPLEGPEHAPVVLSSALLRMEMD